MFTTLMADIDIKIPTPAVERMLEVPADATAWERLTIWSQAAALGFWNRPFVAMLVLLMLVDIVTGVIKAGIKGTVSSQFAFKSHLQKIQMIMAVLFGLIVDVIFPFPLPGMSWSASFAFLMCLIEMWSIIENLRESGVPMPKMLDRIMAEAKERKEHELDRATGHIEENLTVTGANITLIDNRPDSKSKTVINPTNSGAKGDKGDKGERGAPGESAAEEAKRLEDEERVMKRRAEKGEPGGGE